MEQCSETLTYQIQMPGNYPEESVQHIYLRFKSRTLVPDDGP